MILIVIQVDAAVRVHEVADHTRRAVIDRIIDADLQDIPTFRNGTAVHVDVEIRRVDWLHAAIDRLSWWTSIKIACSICLPAVVFAAVMVAR